jgi:membrane protease YdiL (CAAX protease family)
MDYLILLLYPVVAMFTPEPVQFRWWIRAGGAPMPKSVLEKSVRNEVPLLIAKFVVIIAATYLIVRWIRLPLRSVGFTLQQPISIWTMGVVVSLFEIFCALRMQGLADQLRTDEAGDRPLLFLRQPSWKIFVTILVGGFAEEFWRSISLVLFIQSGHPTNVAIIVTSVAFGVGHLQSPQPLSRALARILRPALVGVPLAVLFLWSKSLVIPFLVHVTLNSFAALMGRKKMVLSTG